MSPRCVVANLLDCDILESEFELKSLYYVNSQTNILGKDINPLIRPNYEVNSKPIVLLQRWICY